MSIFSYGQNVDTIIKQIINDINQQEYFVYEHFKFKNVELIYEFDTRDCGDIENGILIEKTTFNSPEERDIVEFINKQISKVYPIFKQGQIVGTLADWTEDDWGEDVPLYQAKVCAIDVFKFKQDTFVNIVFFTGYDPGSYDNYYHCLFAFNNFKFMASFESMDSDTQPFGDFNNDGNLDFAVYSWHSNLRVVLYTLRNDIFEICTDYKLRLKYDDRLFYHPIDKKTTKINVFLDEQWITIP